MKRILIVRNDQMGDFILTLPLFEAIKEAVPGVELSALISPQNFKIARANPWVDDILLDDYGRDIGGFRDLYLDLRKRHFDAAILAVPSFRAAMALLLAGIPKRVGPGTHAYCFPLLSNTRAQHRSRARKHETEYTLELLSLLGLKIRGKPGPPKINCDPEDLRRGQNKLQSVQPHDPDARLVVLHPGSRGSAMNWPTKKWAELVDMLQSSPQIHCVVTGSKQDRKHIQTIFGRLTRRPPPDLIGQTDVGELAGVLSMADAFVGPSTGPLHLAAALGVKTFAIFPPIPAQSAKRWGPWGTIGKTVFAPQVICPATTHCIGEKCAYYNCLDRIYPETVTKKIEASLQTSGAANG